MPLAKLKLTIMFIMINKETIESNIYNWHMPMHKNVSELMCIPKL